MTFEPTEEQFRDPLKYLEEIFALGHHYGIVKIIPPASWRRQTAQATPHFEMVPGEPTLFNSKRLTVARRKVVPTKHGEAAVLLTLKVQNDFQSFDLATFEAIRDTKKRKQIFDAAGDSVGRESAFWDHLLNTEQFNVQYASDVPGVRVWERERVCVCVFACVKCVHIQYTYIYIHTYIHIYVYIHKCIYIYIHTYVSISGSATTAADGDWDMATLSNASFLGGIRALGGVDICGVNTPMMYMGQPMAPFAFHYEDNALFSINVLYKGAPKHWYGVPGRRDSDYSILTLLNYSIDANFTQV
jgi:hypothetical protein